MVSGTRGQGHDSVGRILFGGVGKGAGVHNVKIGDVVCLAVGVEDRALGIAAHAASSDFVISGRIVADAEDFGFAGCEDLAAPVLDGAIAAPVFVAQFPMASGAGQSVTILNVVIEVDI